MGISLFSGHFLMRSTVKQVLAGDGTRKATAVVQSTDTHKGSPSVSQFGRNMPKYFLYSKVSQKCQRKQFEKSP